MQKRLIYGGVITAVIILLGASVWLWLLYQGSEAPKSMRSLHAKTGIYGLEVVTSQEDQIKGLSFRPRLDKKSGMLFDFKAIGTRCIWMKDMHFPLDIIWTDGWHVVTRVETNVSPDTYPKSFCADARYVIELNAGTATRNDIKPGTQLDF